MWGRLYLFPPSFTSTSLPPSHCSTSPPNLLPSHRIWAGYSVLSLLFTGTVELEATKHKPVSVFGCEAKAACSKLINNPKVGSKHPLKHVCLSQHGMLNREGQAINICCFHIRVSLPVLSEGWHFNAIYLCYINIFGLHPSFVSARGHAASPVSVLQLWRVLIVTELWNIH